MTRLIRAAGLCTILLTPAVLPAQAQVPHPRLEPGAPIRAEIRADEIHRIELALEAGQFAYISVVEQGIDLAVKLTGPEGRILGWYDGGKGGERHDPLSAVTLFAQVSGPHWVDIHPVDPLTDTAGSYAARLERLEPAASTPLGRVEQWLGPWDRDAEPGLAVGIARKGEPVFLQGYGEASVEHDVAIRSETVFHVASITKQFVAFAIQLLVERGEISLDEDIRTYLPWVPDLGATITVRHLLHHTHGLPGQLPRLKLAGWEPWDVHVQRHVLDLVRRQGRLQFEPGSEYMYTNTGYELLVEAVEAVTGQTFGEWAEANLFEPLGMTRTFVKEDLRRLIPDRAGAYLVDADRGVLREPEFSTSLVGGVGLYTTVEDLLKWAHNLDTGALGGEAVRDRMRERGTLDDGTVLDYASGLEIRDHPGGTLLFHGGGWYSTRSFLVVFPDEDLAIAIITNRGGFDRSNLARRLVELLLPSFTVAGNYSYADMEPHRGEPGAGDPAAGEPDPARLDAFTGRYVLPDDDVHLFRSGDRLWLHQGVDSPPVALRLSGDTARMVLPAEPVRLVFERDETGAVVGFLELIEGEPGEEAQKRPPYSPGRAEILEYEGTYWSEELRSEWTFHAEDGRLIGHHRRRGPVMRLEPLSPDHFRGDGWAYEEVEFVRHPDGRVTAVLFSSGRYRDERFEKLGYGETALADSSAQRIPRFEAGECPFDTSGIDVETLDCGYLSVPESREADGGRTLRLAVAVTKPPGAAKDPVALLPGGPGGGPLPGFISRVREWIPADRALVVFDPRGTGYSGPVMCPWLDATYGAIAALDVSLQDGRRLRRGAELACRDRLLRRGIDLDAYNSTTVALDLRDLREALGYDRWNLLAASYGVPFARALMRLDPDGVRSAVLAIGPTQDLTRLQARDVPFFARALDRVFEGCAARASCRERYPDLRDEFYRTYEALDERPLTVPVSANDFRSSRFTVNSHDYVRTVYAQLWSESDVSHLPALIRAFGDRDTAIVREVVEREFGGVGSDFSWGMMYSVDCYDAHTPDSRTDFREAAAPFPSPLAEIEFFLRPCPYWSTARAPAEERAPLRSSIPALVLDGEFDPASPPAVGEKALQGLSEGHHVTIPGMSHMPGPRSAECWASVIENFFERPDRRPDADCTEELPEVKILPELPPWARSPRSDSSGPETGPANPRATGTATARDPDAWVPAPVGVTDSGPGAGGRPSVRQPPLTPILVSPNSGPMPRSRNDSPESRGGPR